MSGGSYDYAYCKINDLASQIEDRFDPRLLRGPAPNPVVYNPVERVWVEGEAAKAVIDAANDERKWFVELLKLVSRAAHDIEWVDSGDYGPGDEVAAIRAIRKFIVEKE